MWLMVHLQFLILYFLFIVHKINKGLSFIWLNGIKFLIFYYLTLFVRPDVSAGEIDIVESFDGWSSFRSSLHC